jgi:hypothetical protein
MKKTFGAQGRIRPVREGADARIVYLDGILNRTDVADVY